MQDVFRFVLVGTGNIGGTYARAIEKLEDVEIAGAVSRSLRNPGYLPPGAQVYPQLSAVDVSYDAVILCTPNGLHHQGAMEAAHLGKHVLTEKVLDINAANMDAMIKTCADAGVNLGVSYQRRMSPDNVAIKALLEKGALGRVFAADMRVKFYRDMAYYDSGDYRGGFAIDGGGPFIQQAAHNVDVYVWFFGMPSRVVSMLDTFTHEIEVEDHGIALLRYESGMIGSITASTATKPGFAPILELHAEKGSCVMENDEITLWEMEGLENPSKKTEFEVHSGADSAAVADTAGHEAIISDFVSAARDGREPAVPASSGRLATDLVTQIYAANVA